MSVKTRTMAGYLVLQQAILFLNKKSWVVRRVENEGSFAVDLVGRVGWY